MKLRNKKTGDIVEIYKIGLVWNKYGMPADIGQYESLAELNKEWEDYDSTEPLIKDEKIRKAVRAWAEANDENEIMAEHGGFVFLNGWARIQFDALRGSFEIGNHYTIAELCGEEEE